jgi:hypothetical protein
MLTPSDKVRRQLTPEERDLLAEFAQFQIGLEELTLKLRGMLELNFSPEERRFTSYFLWLCCKFSVSA